MDSYATQENKQLGQRQIHTKIAYRKKQQIQSTVLGNVEYTATSKKWWSTPLDHTCKVALLKKTVAFFTGNK